MKNMGDGRRVARVEKEVQSVVSTFVIQRLQSELPGLVTVTKVMIPADLRTAKVFVSLLQSHVSEISNTNSNDLNLDQARDSAVKKDLEQINKSVKILQSWAPDIQNEIGRKLQMKYLPKLTFMADESTDKILKIERLISTLNHSPSKINKDDLDEVDDLDDLESED